ncbi:hypothetical protein JOD27_008385 [Lentzea nigeriaca]|nr:hypothetical protein [Lentzea nigeriaca]
MHVAAEMAVEKCRRKRLLITPAAANRAVGSHESAIFMIEARLPAGITLTVTSQAIAATRYSHDSLFPGCAGKTTSPDNFVSLINDVEDRLFAVLPDDTWFYPGHGDDSTLGKERPSLAEWRARGW